MNETLLHDIGQRLNWTLLHSAWQFAAIALVLAIVLRLLTSRSPHLRYRFMLAALFTMMVAPVVTFCVVDSAVVSSDEFVASSATDAPTNDRQPGKESSRINAGLPVSIPQTNLASQAHSNATALQDSSVDTRSPFNSESLLADVTSTLQVFVLEWMNVILASWLLGVSVLSIRPLVGWRATRGLRSQGRTSVPAPIAIATARMADRLGVGQAIEIAQSSLVDVPTVIGWIKPLVLLPASAICGLSTEQIDAVIAHELAHVRRHDYLANVFQLAMETVFFYHPAVWWVSHCMRLEREECCDDIAVHMTGDRIGYAKLLVWLEEARNSSARPSFDVSAAGISAVGMSSAGGSLIARIRRIVQSPSSSQATGIGPLVIAVLLSLIVGTGVLIAVVATNSTAQDAAKSETVASAEVVQIRNWASRAVELEQWSRLAQLARRLAEVGEYDEALGLLSKAPLGKSREGKLSSKFYYATITNICEIALKHDRLDFTETVLDRLTGPEKQSPINKQFVPLVHDIRIAILQYHVSKGHLDDAMAYLNSQPAGTHLSLVHRVASKLPALGHGDEVESFWRRLTVPKLREVCEHQLANAYYHLHEPDKIWRLADEIAKARPNDLIAEVRLRNTAMVHFGKYAADRFDERLPSYRDKIRQLPEDEQTRYWEQLALSAAKAKRYELVADLSASVPLLLQSQIWLMDLSGSDRHPVLYAITELHKQQKIDQALAIIDEVEDESVALASLARMADLIEIDHKIDGHDDRYQAIVNRFALAYREFAAKHDVQAVREIERGLPEKLNVHLRRIAGPSISPEDVAYLDGDHQDFLVKNTHFLIEQDKANEVVDQALKLLIDSDSQHLRMSKWMAGELAKSGHADAFDRLRPKVNEALRQSGAKDSDLLGDYRRFLAESAGNAYSAGQHDRCFEIMMKLDKVWFSPSMVSRIANKARQNGDLAFLRRMESSTSSLMRAEALESLALYHVLVGDTAAAKEAAQSFDREFGQGKERASIYGTITHESNVKDPKRRLAALEMSLPLLAFDSIDYPILAGRYAKLLKQLSPGKPLPADWLKKLSSNPTLQLQVELDHAFSK